MIEVFEKIKIRYYLLVLTITSIILFIKMDGSNKANNLDLFGLLLNSIMLIYIAIMYIKHRNENKIDFSPFKKKECLKEGFKLYIFNLIFAIGTILLLPLVFHFLPKSLVDSLNNETPITSTNPLITILAGSIMAPIIEELTCRGIIFSRLKLKFGFSKAVIISSLIFAILHIKVAILHAFIFGISMCLLFKKYNNIFLNIGVHFLNNLILIPTTLFLNDSSSTEPFPIFKAGELAAATIISLILIALSGIWLYRYFKNNWIKK